MYSGSCIQIGYPYNLSDGKNYILCWSCQWSPIPLPNSPKVCTCCCYRLLELLR